MQKRNRAIAAVLLFCSLAALMTGCKGTGEAQAEPDADLPKIVVGSDDYPPFNYSDPNGKPTGIDVDLATEAFARMGYEPEFVYINWEDKKHELESGAIDCIWGSFTMDGREADYRWAGPYMMSYQVVAVRQDSDIDSLADLEDKIVAVQSTTKPEELFTLRTDSRIPRIRELFSLQNRELIYAFLSKGYADAVAAHEIAILQYMKDYQLEYRILEEPLLTVGIGVAFSKDDDRGLEAELTATFREMQADGTTARILSRYLSNPERYLEVDAYAK